MERTSPTLPEDILIATLHRVGEQVRLTDDDRLSEILDDAAASGDGLFAPFKAHPLYGHSRLLGETLQTLDHAGSIVRENAAQLYFRPTKHTVGPFGKCVYERLSEEERTSVDHVADKIRNTFGGADEPRSATA